MYTMSKVKAKVGRHRGALNVVLFGDCRKALADLATAWCGRHTQYAHLQSPPLAQLSRQELKCARDNTPFVSVHELVFERHDSDTVRRECLQVYGKSLILIVKECRGDSNYSSFANEEVFVQLNRHGLPFVVTMEANTSCLVDVIEDALKGTFPNNVSLNRHLTLSLPFLACITYRDGCRPKLQSLAISDSQLRESFISHEKTNRMIDRYGAENFLVVDFNHKMNQTDIVAVLSKGVLVDGEAYQFIGCSSSGLKKRSCYLMKGTVRDVGRVRDIECGQFLKIATIPKQLKGIGLLFSNVSPTGVEVADDHILIVDDIESEDGRYNFTDGCGGIGSELHRAIVEGANLRGMLPEGYVPSVFQIRLKGYKGVVVLDPALDKNSILIRKSMIKFESGTRPFPQVWLCNYSKPYSIGYLNQQYIMLLSGLGVTDEVLLKKQCDYYEQMRSSKQNPAVSFDQLCIGGQYGLAAQVAMGNHNSTVIQEELSQIQRKFLQKISKLRIQVHDSRTVFGICDPSGTLDYGECFFRPTISGYPHTICGNVIVAKNPCYFLGDVRVLTAVDGSRVKHLRHLVDCVVFPTKGKRPHPDEITGSDLDGDEYFVCWDEELSIAKLKPPEDFLGLSKASRSKGPHWRSCIEYVAGQVNLMGLLNSYYMFWAETKGVASTECQELGQLFSRSVDASKTGDRFVVPKHLIPPSERPTPKSTAVWKQMEVFAVDFSNEFTESIIKELDSLASVSEDFITGILQSKTRNIPEFDLFNLLRRWCNSRLELTDSECMKKLVEFSKHINFGKLTLKQKLSVLESGVPVETVSNALNSTHLLTTDMMQKVSLCDRHNRWSFFFQAVAAEFNWHDLLTAVTTYPESLIIFKLSSGVIFALHFLSNMKIGEYQLVAGSAIGYLFSSSFNLLCRHVLGSTYSIDLNADFLQLYRQGVKLNTFVWIKSKVVTPKTVLAETDFDRISIDLPTFQKDILTKYGHPKVNKEHVDVLEVYVSNGTEEPTYYDRLLSNLACDNLESLDREDEVMEEIPRNSEEEGESTVPQGNASLIECLQFYAQRGKIDDFSGILQLILASDERDGLVHELRDAVCLLFSVFVEKCVHLRQSDMHLDRVVVVLTSLQFAIHSAKICIFILYKVSLLHSLDVTQTVGDIVLSCIELESTVEYLEVLLHWEWWYFMPPALARSLAAKLYSLSRSLVSDTLIPTAVANVRQLCADTSELPTELGGCLEQYIHYYAYLHHSSFLEEMYSLQSKESEGSNDHVITKLKVCDPANLLPDAEEENEEEAGKRLSQRKLEFHRSKGISSRLDGYVIISFMSSGVRESGFVPVACGLVTEVSRQPTNVLVKVSEPIPVCIKMSIRLGIGHWQLHCVGNVTSFLRAMRAIMSLADSGPRSTTLASILVHPEGAVYGTEKQQHASPNFAPREHKKLEPISLNPLYNRRKCVPLKSKQLQAIHFSLNLRLTLIHGPPGTGKTWIAAEIVCHYLAQKLSEGGFDEHSKVLVAAETNLAVDNLARRLMQLDINVVRVGNREQMSHDIYSQISLETLVARSSESRRSYLDRKVAAKILRDADVVAATCTGAGDSILKNFKFPFVIIDEATQVTEPTSLIALTKKCQQLTLIGDPEQLAPFHVLSQSGCGYDSTPSLQELSVTLFHRLQRVVPAVVLEEQYRMSSSLVKFPSMKFYGGKLVCSPNIEQRLPNFELRRENAIDFVDVASSKEKHMGTSFQNEEEADTVVDVVKFLLDCNVSPFEITVLTPYRAQVLCLIEKLSKSVSNVEVSTIDNFQGKENDIIVFTTVRSNVQGDLSFIASRNRVNVLLTRAKYCVIGVGCMAALQTVTLWKDWLQGASVVSTVGQFLGKLSIYSSNSKTAKPFYHRNDEPLKRNISQHKNPMESYGHSCGQGGSQHHGRKRASGKGEGSRQHRSSSRQQGRARVDGVQHRNSLQQHSGSGAGVIDRLQQHSSSSQQHSAARVDDRFHVARSGRRTGNSGSSHNESEFR